MSFSEVERILGRALTDGQKTYLQIILDQITKIVKENELPREFVEKYFFVIFTEVHNSYQNFLKGLMTNEEFKKELAEKIWNEFNKAEGENK